MPHGILGPQERTTVKKVHKNANSMVKQNRLLSLFTLQQCCHGKPPKMYFLDQKLEVSEKIGTMCHDVTPIGNS